MGSKRGCSEGTVVLGLCMRDADIQAYNSAFSNSELQIAMRGLRRLILLLIGGTRDAHRVRKAGDRELHLEEFLHLSIEQGRNQRRS